MSGNNIGTYVCSGGETFDSIALSLFMDEQYACDLLAANPSLCQIMVFKGGEVLSVPDLDIIQEEYQSAVASDVAPWKG